MPALLLLKMLLVGALTLAFCHFSIYCIYLAINGSPPLAASRVKTKVSPVSVNGSFPFITYSAYFYHHSNETVRFQTIGFSKCRPENESMRLMIGNASFPMWSQVLDYSCPNIQNCVWADYSFYADVPVTVDRSQEVKIALDNATIVVGVTESSVEERPSGLEVCVAPLYYYNHWVRVIEFIELYRQQNASHFFVYVSSVSRLVEDLLEVYQLKGLVTVVRWPELPKIDSTTDNVFRFGQNAAIMDCLRRSAAKFVAVVDMDDYTVVRNETLLGYLERKEREDPTISAFRFDMVMAHQEPRVGNLTDWRSIGFEGLEAAMISDDQINYKSIVMPERVEVVTPHLPIVTGRMRGGEGVHQNLVVSKDVGVSYHVRYANGLYRQIYGLSDQKIQTKEALYAAEIVENVKSNFTQIMDSFSRSHADLTIPATAEVMDDCNRYKPGECQTPYLSCRDKMESVDTWIYAKSMKI